MYSQNMVQLVTQLCDINKIFRRKKMKKTLAMILCLVLCAALFAGCGSTAEADSVFCGNCGKKL